MGYSLSCVGDGCEVSTRDRCQYAHDGDVINPPNMLYICLRYVLDMSLYVLRI
jgi:hypothetical protein